MRLNITLKLFILLVITMSAIVGATVWAMQWSFDRGFLDYISTFEESVRDRMASQLSEVYVELGHWPDERYWNLDRELRDIRARMRNPNVELPLPETRRYEVVVTDAAMNIVYPAKKSEHRNIRLEQYVLREIRTKDKPIGYVGFFEGEFSNFFERRDRQFLDRQTKLFIQIAVLTMAACAVIALPFSRQLARPVKRLSEAARSLAAGNYDVRIEAHSSDEVGQLSRDFNHLAQTLDKHEKARQRWMADIAHELRTPLSVMLANLEAIEDGVRKPDANAVKQLHGQVVQLTRLVNDLHELSMADIGALTYQMELVSFTEIIVDSIDMTRRSFETADITVQTELNAGDVRILGDESRLKQLVDNLLSNTLAYTDPHGRLLVRVFQERDRLIADFQDSPPGVPDEALPKLFDRLYRVDTSRHRNGGGGSGLGLAICATIVEAHRGEISARHSPLGGLWMRVVLPVAK